MLNDPKFTGQVVDYPDSIISECINPYESEGKPDEMTLPLTSNFDTDEEYGRTMDSTYSTLRKMQTME